MGEPADFVELGHLSPWKLETAKARFSEVVRRCRHEGPQRVTLHGRDAAVVLSAEDYRRLTAAAAHPEGAVSLFDIMRRFPQVEVDLDRPRYEAPVRDVDF